MQGTTRHWKYQLAWVVLYGLALLSLLGLVLIGQPPSEVAVRSTVTAALVRSVPVGVRWRYTGRRRGWGEVARRLGRYLRVSWPPVLLRSLALWGMWEWSGRWGPSGLWLLPWVLWLWQGLGVGWPEWRGRALWRSVDWGLWQVQRLLLLGYVVMGWQRRGPGDEAGWGLGAGCVVCGRDESWVQVERQSDGSYQATLCGHFTLNVAGDHPFRMRLLILFLGLLDGP